MSVIDRIKAQAKTSVKHIVLAEGSEPRTVQAAAKIVAEGLARITLVGNPEEIAKVARRAKRAKPMPRSSASCGRRRA